MAHSVAAAIRLLAQVRELNVPAGMLAGDRSDAHSLKRRIVDAET
jgi:hypothetical protein